MSIRFGKRSITGRKRNIAGLLALALASVIGVSAYAFTASNTVASHSAGAGAATVSGYTVASPTNYTFSGDGLTMTKVTFDLDKAATDVAVALTAATPETKDWTDCGATEGLSPFAVTCTFGTPIPDGEGLKLSVAAVSSGTVTIE
ncbi:MAG TPA: hypothetical protein VES97_10950 [Solirubrobacteraceae bacterium]|nr:hypothetical protein [Solirubrobacteraceae bacterium]